MALQFDVKITGDKQLQRTFSRIQKWSTLELPKLTFKQAVEGARYARDIAPKRTHALFNAIRSVGNRGKGKGSQSSIVSMMPRNQKRGKPRPYHIFMHGMQANGYPYYDTSGRIRTGDPRYMFTTGKYLEEKYPEKVSKSLDRKIKQK